MLWHKSYTCNHDRFILLLVIIDWFFSPSLKSLSLKDNCLSDAGVRHFTLPRRFFKSGLGKLSVLDLSLNPNITDKSVKHIAKLHSLSALNLSGTRISFGHGVPQLMKDTTLCLALDVSGHTVYVVVKF